ncbi:MAG: J domain-containing protein [Anaerolineales bacterium]|nr:J domain-containing protein [Anaerolineales bacterium]
MSNEIIISKSPEEEELAKKRAELEALKQVLAQEELNLATLENELGLFEGRYLRTVGVLYAQLDEILARIAEKLAMESPHDPDAQSKAEQARNQAEQSASAAKETNAQIQSAHFSPSEEIKALFRKAAKLMHPDLASDEEDRARRTNFMAEVNIAYRAGDVIRLQKLLSEWENSPEAVRGHDTGAELVRVIRSIARVRERLESIKSQIRETQAGELYILKTKHDEAERDGRNLFSEMVANLNQEIEAAEKKLGDLV